MKTRLFTLGLAAVLWVSCGLQGLRAGGAAPTGDSSSRLLREAALMLLKEGNLRFAAGKILHPNQDAERRTNTAVNGQEPFASVLACSDSRDPVELIFDRGIGDLFVVRVAGNIAGPSELATVEYGVDHLGTPLLVVMGHSRCGAVTAVVKGAELHGHLPLLAARIKPAVQRVLATHTNLDTAVPESIKANVWQTIADITQQSSAVRARVQSGRLLIVGAVYDLESGRVQWLGQHPEMESLLAASPAAPGGHEPAAAPLPSKTTAAATKPPKSAPAAH